MQKLWTDNPGQIINSLSSLINRHVRITLLIPGNPPQRARILKIQQYNGNSYLILNRPRNIMRLTVGTTAFIYQITGQPAFCFPCSIVNGTAKHIAVRLPEDIFLIQRRAHSRILSPKGSRAKFLLPEQQRINVCALQDISIGGAGLIDKQPFVLGDNGLIGPTTFILPGPDTGKTRQLTLKNVQLVRRKFLPRDFVLLGLRFILTPRERKELERYLALLAQDTPSAPHLGRLLKAS